MTVWRRRIACWITKVINTDSEYVTLISSLLQHLLQERASMLRYTYTACLIFAWPLEKYSYEFDSSCYSHLCIGFIYIYFSTFHTVVLMIAIS